MEAALVKLAALPGICVKRRGWDPRARGALSRFFSSVVPANGKTRYFIEFVRRLYDGLHDKNDLAGGTAPFRERIPQTSVGRKEAPGTRSTDSLDPSRVWRSIKCSGRIESERQV